MSITVNPDVKFNNNDNDDCEDEDYEDDNKLGKAQLLPIQSKKNVMLMLSHRSWPKHQQVNRRLSLKRHENN